MTSTMHGNRTVPAALLAALALLRAATASFAADPPAADAIGPQPKRSGSTFLGAALRVQQADDAANPGMLWVAEGEQLWRTPAGRAGKPCAACHDAASMNGVAARYPAIDAASGELMNLELRINACRTRHQQADALAWESEPLLALTAYVASKSRGVPIGVAVDGPARGHFENGRRAFTTRQGQLNLACSQCHDDNWGRKLRGDTISQGHPTGFPIYRIEWQTLGSLQRRLRACALGVRAEVLPFGAAESIDIELYLAARARGLPIETPAIRR